jgi:prefoldin subunit 5
MEVSLYDVSEVFKRLDGESALEVERLRREVETFKKEHDKLKGKLTQVIAKVQELSEFCAKLQTNKPRDPSANDRTSMQ